MSLEDKSEDEIRKLEEKLLDAVEAEGGVMGNISLLRKLRWSEDLYWSVRDRLIDAGQLALGKGKGGSVRRLAPVDPKEFDADAPKRDLPPEISSEVELYEPVATVIKDHWVKDNRFRESLVEITARQGRRETGGKWSRPDLTVVGMTTYTYIPGRHFDVATFEIKPSTALDVTAIYEALAHRRAATRAYVILHVPEENAKARDAIVEEISQEAKRHGIGLIVMSDPSDYDTWDVKLEALRVEPSPERLNDFLASQLSDGGKLEIVQWFK